MNCLSQFCEMCCYDIYESKNTVSVNLEKTKDTPECTVGNAKGKVYFSFCTIECVEVLVD
jgi:hypothetical protein